MSFQPQPIRPGTPRARVFNNSDDRQWKSIFDDDLSAQLARVDKSAELFRNQFERSISPAAGVSDTFAIRPASDVGVGLGSSTNSTFKSWDHGFSRGRTESSTSWGFTKNGQYSKIKVENTSNVLDYPDPHANKWVDFHPDQYTDPFKNHRSVFESIGNPIFPKPMISKDPIVPKDPTISKDPAVLKDPIVSKGPTIPKDPVVPKDPIPLKDPIPPNYPIIPPPLPVTGGRTFEQMWFQLTPQKASQEQYDIIVIGTGMGGGVIAGDLFDTNSRLGLGAKSVLVIEKGGLAFHSHCLNTSRPSGFGEDRGQQNDTFFSLFKENYQFRSPEQRKEWNAGPMFNLGGRGATWGLFVPRIHDESLNRELGPELFRQLVSERSWYRMAEDLMKLYLPRTNAIHADLMERLNINTSKRECQWQWGRIASEFDDSKNFDFASGAYSPIDKLLEIAMSKRRNADGTCVEHPNWKILINSEVRSIIWKRDQAAGVVVRDSLGKETSILLREDKPGQPNVNTRVILSAGSVGSPAILMRSGMTDELKDNFGLHLTDHDIFAKAFTFQYTDPAMRERVGSMKLQSYVRLSSGKISLVNVAVDASTFLPRALDRAQSFITQDFPKLIVAHIMPAPLDEENTIELDAKGEPVVIAERRPKFSNSDKDVKELRELTKDIIRVMKNRLKMILRPTDPDERNEWDDETFFNPLELGGVAHELGTIPLENAQYRKKRGYLLEQDLRLRDRKGVYVCDLSIFPYSPEVNPTLTLVALALRLSRWCLPRTPVLGKDVDTVYVMNQTGERVKVYISNRAGVQQTQEEINDNVDGRVLRAGEILARKRTREVEETAMVYRLDYNSKVTYQPRPTLHLASPGDLSVVD